jgi:hypothetical protein
MSEKVSTAIGDFFRWIIALILLPIVVWLIFLFFMYPFEWLLIKSTNWGAFFHVLFWFMIGSFIVGLTTALGGALSSLSVFLVRQSSAYIFLMSLALLALVGFCIYGAWSNNVEFSWEILRYSTFNKILFTFLILNILQIPAKMYSTSQM